MSFQIKDCRVAVIGLGYVGMPLAVSLSRDVPVVGFDISQRRVKNLKNGIDENNELSKSDLGGVACDFTNDVEDIKNCNVYIVTVPTPLDDENNPDLGPVRRASEMISSCLKKGDIVVYESTVYPGVTEDICGTVLESKNDLKCGTDFFLGYSPERINPGDKVHTVDNITKVVAGQNEEVSKFLGELYGLVTNGNIFLAKDIRTAEASKAIENAQRDINVAFINEVTMVLNRLGLSSHDVLEAAGTKWNFLPFTPGLVGGHCIGVDPYYLASCAKAVGHDPEIILAGRKINDGMGAYIANLLDEKLSIETQGKKNILFLGFTFKENINDIRNTKIIDIYHALIAMGHSVDIHDPYANAEDVEKEYGVTLLDAVPTNNAYDGVAFLVEHDAYKDMPLSDLRSILKEEDGVIFDLKGAWRGRDFGGLHYFTL